MGISEMSVVEKYNLTPFAGTDFNNWNFRMKSLLREAGVMEAIESQEFHEKKDKESMKIESRAQALIIAGVANSHLEYIKNKKSAFEMYANLEQNFKKKGTRSILFLRRQLNQIMYNEKSSLSQHFLQLDSIFSQIEDAGDEFKEEEKINCILLSMPSSYDNVITALDTMDKLSLDFVKNRLLGEEDKRKRGNISTLTSPDYAFSCFNCGQKGHKKFECSRPGGGRSRGHTTHRGGRGITFPNDRGRTGSRSGWARGASPGYHQRRRPGGRQLLSAEGEQPAQGSENMRKKKAKINPENERGFEALLRPIQDCIAKDWQHRICVYLEFYIQFIHEPGNINFTEAAIIIQNSSSYYCRRVDSVYDWVREFAIILTRPGDEKKPVKETSSRNRKKVDKKAVDVDPFKLELMSHANPGPAAEVYMPLEDFDFPEVKTVALNKCDRVPFKEGIIVMLIDLDDDDMGSRQQYQLNGIISDTGALYDDVDMFQNDHVVVINDSPRPDNIYVDQARNELENRSLFINDNPPMEVDDDSEHDFRLDHDGPIDDQHSIASVQNGPQREESEDPYTKVYTTACSAVHRKFKLMRQPKVPTAQTVLLKKLKAKRIKRLPPEGYVDFNLSFSEILNGIAEDMITYRLRRKKAERIKLLQILQNEANNNAENASDLNENGENDFEMDERLDDLEDSLDTPMDDVLNNERQREKSFAKAYAESVTAISEFHKKKGEALQTALRVAAWHDSMRDVLANAQKRSEFDVHAYGTTIIEGFGVIGETRDFSEIVTGQPRAEICRYLLSSLMLANTYNVELSKSDPSELSKDCLKLKLISTVRHHEELDANVAVAAAAAGAAA